jgi:hypothetical protein
VKGVHAAAAHPPRRASGAAATALTSAARSAVSIRCSAVLFAVAASGAVAIAARASLRCPAVPGAPDRSPVCVSEQALPLSPEHPLTITQSSTVKPLNHETAKRPAQLTATVQ